MAANYWQSTQKRDWTYTRAQLSHVRHQLELEESILVQQYPLFDVRIISLFFQHQLLKLAKRLNLRQAVVATAQVYLRRFYTRVPIRRTNPYLMLATALYVACKIEEMPQSIRFIVAEARTLWQEYIGPDISSVGEAEFFLVSTMDCELVVHHPYKTLRMLENKVQLGQEEAHLAWSIVNDSYLTDLPLLCPPHVVACAAMFMALVLKPPHGQGSGQPDVAEQVAKALRAAKGATVAGPGANTAQARVHRFLEWLAESEVDIKVMADAIQEMISLYVVWDSDFKEKDVREKIGRFVKGRGLDK